jgi:hypothetical protein
MWLTMAPASAPLHYYQPVLQIRTIFDRIRIRLLKHLDPDPGLNKLLDKFLLEIFLAQIPVWSKKCNHDKKVKQ